MENFSNHHFWARQCQRPCGRRIKSPSLDRRLKTFPRSVHGHLCVRMEPSGASPRKGFGAYCFPPFIVSATITAVAGPAHLSCGRESPAESRRLYPPDWLLRGSQFRITESRVSEYSLFLIKTNYKRCIPDLLEISERYWCATREKDFLSSRRADIVNLLT